VPCYKAPELDSIGSNLHFSQAVILSRVVEVIESFPSILGGEVEWRP